MDSSITVRSNLVYQSYAAYPKWFGVDERRSQHDPLLSVIVVLPRKLLRKLKNRRVPAETYDTHPCMATLFLWVGAPWAMNQNVTLSFGLSLLTLLFFTVVLRPTDPARDPSPPREASSRLEPSPKATPPVAEPEKSEAASKPEERSPKQVEPPSRPSEKTPAKPEARSEPPPAPPSPSPPAPRSPMTAVKESETLEAFAKRVYGPEGDPMDVWKSNRDLLNTPKDPIPPGTMLRTP